MSMLSFRATPWLLALAAAVATLALARGTASQRVTVAFVVAEVVAVGGLLAAVLVPPRRDQPSSG